MWYKKIKVMDINKQDQLIVETIRRFARDFCINNNEVKGKFYQNQQLLSSGETVEFDFGWKHVCFQNKVVPDFWVEDIKLFTKDNQELDKSYLSEKLDKPIIDVDITLYGNSIYALRYNGIKINQYEFYSFYGINDDFIRELKKLEYGEFLETDKFVFVGSEFDNS